MLLLWQVSLKYVEHCIKWLKRLVVLGQAINF